MIRNQDMQILFGKLTKEALAARRYGITQAGSPSVYISSNEGCLFILRATTMLDKNDRKPALFHTRYFQRNSKARLAELPFLHLEQEKENVLKLATFFKVIMKQTKLSFH